VKGFWITFTDGTSGYCEGGNEFDAAQIAEKISGKKIGGGPYKNFTMKPLPYPAKPVIWQFDHPVNGKCPPFCYKPQQCAGKTSCPQNYACSE
jgi:hypothetical protein